MYRTKNSINKLLVVFILVVITVIPINIAFADEIYEQKYNDGWNKIDNEWYYYKNNVIQTGWIKTGNKWYYLDNQNNGIMKTGKYKVGDKYYISDSNGAMYSNRWVKLDNSWYYATNSGSLKTGWFKNNNKWYYLNFEGLMLTGKYNDGKKYYYSENSGAMLTGWIRTGNDWYFADNSGALKNGWVKSGNKWYWLRHDNVMSYNCWVSDKGQDYYLTSSGAMATGWLKVDNNWYYLNSSGSKFNGWKKSGDKWYYLDKDIDSKMIHSTYKYINSEYYSFDKNGAMLENTLTHYGDNYGYATSSGAIIRIGVKNRNNIILKNDRNNILIGWQKIGDYWFYGDKDGIMLTGWLEDNDGKRYYLNSDGTMVTGVRNIDGKTYAFSNSGDLVNITGDAELDVWLVNKARSLKTMRACYDYVVSLKHINWAGEDARYTSGTYNCTDNWVVSEAKRYMQGKPIDCYGKAAMLACLYKALGYDAKASAGYVKTKRGWASHGWTEVIKNDKTYVYDAPLGKAYPKVNFYEFIFDKAPASYKK